VKNAIEKTLKEVLPGKNHFRTDAVRKRSMQESHSFVQNSKEGRRKENASSEK
jgi:hypothetical protein